MIEPPLPDFNFILFGATGNLALSKLIPTLSSIFYYAVPNVNNAKIVCIGRESITSTEYIKLAYDFMVEKSININEDIWNNFANNIEYYKMDITKISEYQSLKQKIDKSMNIVFYFATPPSLFETIAYCLYCSQLNHSNTKIVLEKPLGDCLESATKINNNIKKYFKEEQIFRIDHYLGKESVQNLLAIRFSNTIFSGLWSNQWIKSVQITIAEDEGIEGRGAFYDQIGALRDVLQNHLLQLLCFIAMEKPNSLSADDIRDEKLKVLKSLKSFNDSQDVFQNVISGQYVEGILHNRIVNAYIEEPDISLYSRTETFIALKTYINNNKWQGVPFYLRTGKRLAKKVAEVIIDFKDINHSIFSNKNLISNKLIIQLQPNDNIKLYFLTKEYGTYNKLQSSYLNLSLVDNQFILNKQSGYYRLLLDVIRGKLGLFVRADEQLAAWHFIEPILDTWHIFKTKPQTYSAGSWGPQSAHDLISAESDCWYEKICKII